MKIQLGVNIDHVATLREARGGEEPQILRAALEAVRAGADGITVHLREDRRHIQDHDLPTLKRHLKVPLNLEMALSSEIIKIALRLKPEKVCLVPEKRQELTTEGGLDAFSKRAILKRNLPAFRKKKIEVSLFIDPSLKQIRTAYEVGAQAIEIHTGTYANARGMKKKRELARIQKAARFAHSLGLKVNAGHGLDTKNVKAIARIPEIQELNIGYAIICRSVFLGLQGAVREMKKAIRS